MAFPIAAHTFDFTRVYTSTRDDSAPGAGVWSGSTLIFDGSGDSSEAVTFSAGALDSLDSRGIICNSKTNKLTFLGDGLPTAPILINITGEGNVGSSDFWDTTQGAFKHGSDYYMPYYSSTGGLKIAKSSDDGATWTKKDEGNGPSAITVAQDSTINRVDNKICVCTWMDNGETDLAIWEFDMTTDLWSAVIANVASNMTRFALSYRWTNALFKFLNGDYLVVYMTNTFVAPFGVYPVARFWTQATNTWGPELILPGRDFAQAVMDPDLNIVHLMTYDTTSRSSTVHYSEFNHNSNTLTTDITTFINGASSDGVGHSSIQNGKLFVPLDKAADFANAVFVASIPVVSFSKELLPVPATAQGVIASIGLNGNGTGYVNGDTFTVDGGILPLAIGVVNHVFNNAIASSSGAAAGTGYVAGDTFTVDTGSTLAHGKVLTVGALGIVTSYALLTLGAGYAVATVATTATSGVGTGLTLNILSRFNGVSDVTINDGGQGYSVNASVATTATSGVGVGLTINILTISTKIPTCAYMMFPNGYSLSPDTITLDFDLVGASPGLTAVNPSGPGPGPVITPTECINQQ
jgi:hypothetical protein